MMPHRLPPHPEDALRTLLAHAGTKPYVHTSISIRMAC
jgi:hypothetical protein